MRQHTSRGIVEAAGLGAFLGGALALYVLAIGVTRVAIAALVGAHIDFTGSAVLMTSCVLVPMFTGGLAGGLLAFVGRRPGRLAASISVVLCGVTMATMLLAGPVASWRPKRRAGLAALARGPIRLAYRQVARVETDNRLVRCDRHGPQPQTFVCRHVVEGVANGRPVGFWWAADSDNPRPDAWCTACNDRLEAGGGCWTPELEMLARVALICGSCYDEAKRVHGGVGRAT